MSSDFDRRIGQQFLIGAVHSRDFARSWQLRAPGLRLPAMATTANPGFR